MEDSRLSIGALYGGGSTTIKTEKKTKTKVYSPKSSNKKNSFSHYDANEENEKDKSSESEQWRKQNRILQSQLNTTKKELEEMKRVNVDLKRKLELLQQ